MFSLPIGNNEKKGTMPDLEKKSSEIDYGVISYFLPKIFFVSNSNIITI